MNKSPLMISLTSWNRNWKTCSIWHEEETARTLWGENMANVVTFRTMEGKNTTEEKMKLIQAAAKLIKEDIKAIKTSHEIYPACDDLESLEAGIDFLPSRHSEGTARGTIIFLEGKLQSIGQAIMQATRPRVLLPPLQCGLGVQLYHHLASQFLIDSLHHHAYGFCCSYKEQGWI